MIFLVALGAGSLLALTPECFLKPSRDQFPETWFHLIGGNVAKPGLDADLDAIAAAGISGIQLFHGQFGGPWPGVTNQIPCLSRDWDDLIRFAAEGCAGDERDNQRGGERRLAEVPKRRMVCRHGDMIP